MCFDYDSLPPVPALKGAAVDHRDLVLEAADGNRFAAFAAYPAGGAPSTEAVVILPDVRGLYPFYEELALRLAEHSHAAVAFDYFGRTAGVSKRGEDFEFREHVDQTTAEGVRADVAAVVAWLRSEEGGSHTRVTTLGFCFGGRHSWLAAADGHGLAGAIGFYGRPGAGKDGQPGPAQRAGEIAGTDPRADGRRRPGDPADRRRRVRRGPDGGRRRPRAGRLPGRAAQLLRSQAGGLPGRLRRRLATGARLHLTEAGPETR